jgi:hypothetical protein
MFHSPDPTERASIDGSSSGPRERLDASIGADESGWRISRRDPLGLPGGPIESDCRRALELPRQHIKSQITGCARVRGKKSVAVCADLVGFGGKSRRGSLWVIASTLSESATHPHALFASGTGVARDLVFPLVGLPPYSLICRVCSIGPPGSPRGSRRLMRQPNSFAPILASILSRGPGELPSIEARLARAGLWNTSIAARSPRRLRNGALAAGPPRVPGGPIQVPKQLR